MGSHYLAGQNPPHPVAPARRPLPLRTKLQYLYLLRVPILMGIAILFLPVVSLLCFRQLLGNLFVLRPWGIFWTIIATEMLAAGILVVTRVVLLNGLERFGIHQGLTTDVVSKRGLLLTEILAVPMFVAAIFSNGQATSPGDAITRIAFAMSALLVAHIAAFAVLWVSVLVSPRYHIPADQRFPLPFAFMRRWIAWAYYKNLASQETKQGFADIFRDWPSCITAGYFDRHTYLPYPGHLLSFSMLFLSYVLYRLLGYLKHAHLGESFGVPAIAYVIMLFIVLSWMLSIASFFLDRYRLPLLLPALLFILSTNWISDSDHFYELRPVSELAAVTPYQVLNAASRVSPDQDHPNGRVTVIATAGGGIQAAAWTAQVLSGLQAEVKTDSPSKSFANSIAAISSVSGGAVGTMFFVSRYKTTGADQGFPPSTNLSTIVEDAETGALGDIAWAMVYPDFTRALVPFSKRGSNRLIDRGWALEQAWRTRGNLDATLGDWRNGVNEGSRPAVIFNATLVESGEPLLLSTLDLSEKEIAGLGRKMLPNLLPGHDVPVVTAVRLAASFPFVTPASRALYDSQAGQEPNEKTAIVEKKARYHVVDGGYYDNYGVNSLLAFLGEGLNATPKCKAPNILIIQIRSFPSEASSPEGASRGWFYQSWAPLAALMRVRTTGQLVRDREAITNFVALWSARGVKIRLATFEFQGADAPLSWQMNHAQVEAIRNQWQDRIHGQNNQDWLQVSCFFHPRIKECESLPQLNRKEAW